ncbi:MAG: exo-alpha-sialidase [Sedimentisphaerales bacterium]|nr:exo-alpha-sialidase [Sedimentisphaerales bacterium]
MPDKTAFKVVGQDTDVSAVKSYRRMVVGPWCNQPEEYQGYNGFVGWMSFTILSSGRWLMPFSSGYWHASFPQTDELLKDPKNLKFFQDMHKIGCPQIAAPRGGRAHLMHSDDQGRTWSKPTTLIDTELDDRHPSILELDDGTWVAYFFQYAMPGDSNVHACYMTSADQGRTWTPYQRVPGQSGGFCANVMTQLADGSLLWVIDGCADPQAPHTVVGVFRSEDRGKSFKMVSTVNPGHEICEPSILKLPDGRVMLIGRRKSDICYSSDGGFTWTEPVSIGVELYDPHLVLLPSGIIACFHGSYPDGGIRVILSNDLGKTWHGPKENIGYLVDPHVYGYCVAYALDDGTVFLAYIHSGGHIPSDARTEAIWTLKVSINAAADGIKILPAPGSPAEKGAVAGLTGLEILETNGGDPELGEMRPSGGKS